MKPGARDAAALCLVLALAAALRFHAIGVPAYWTDEFFSLQAANGIAVAELTSAARGLRDPAPRLTAREAARPLPDLIQGLRSDNHPPLYFLSLRLWRWLVADGEAGTRSLSALCSLLAIALTWAAARRRAGPWPALGAAVLLGVSSQQIRYAQETRGYSMAVAFVALAVLAVDRLEAGRRRGPWSLVLGASALAAMLTHYFAAGGLAGLAVYALFGLTGKPRRAVLASFGFAGLLFCAVWGPVALEQRGHVAQNNAWSREAQDAHVLAPLARLSSWPAAVLADVHADDGPTAWAAGGLGWIALVLAWRDRGNRLWLAVSLGGVLLVLAVDVAIGGRQLDYARYTLHAAPALAATLAALPGKPAAWLVPVVVFAGLLVRLPEAWALDRPAWREFSRLAARVARPHEPVVVVGSPEKVPAEPLWVYQALIHYAWAPDRAFAFLRGGPRPALRARIRARGSAWLVAEPGTDLAGFGPFRAQDALEYSPDTPRLQHVRFVGEAP